MAEKSENEMNMEAAMGLMINAGDAKKLAKEAIGAAHDGDFRGAHDKMDQATEKLNQAHNTQTGMLTKEAQGKHVQLTLLTVHAQDHLMTAITYIDLAKEIVRLYEVNATE